MRTLTLVLWAFLFLLLTSCGTYRYYQQTPNPALFANQGDFQIGGDIGSSGAFAKAPVAVTDNIGIMGSYKGTLENTYHVKEGEVALGYYGSTDLLGVFSALGYGFGHNSKHTEEDNSTKISQGSFSKPFIQIKSGLSSQDILWGVRGDLVWIVKASHLIYDGEFVSSGNDIKSRYSILEHGFVFA